MEQVALGPDRTMDTRGRRYKSCGCCCCRVWFVVARFLLLWLCRCRAAWHIVFYQMGGMCAKLAAGVVAVLALGGFVWFSRRGSSNSNANEGEERRAQLVSGRVGRRA